MLTKCCVRKNAPGQHPARRKTTAAKQLHPSLREEPSSSTHHDKTTLFPNGVKDDHAKHAPWTACLAVAAIGTAVFAAVALWRRLGPSTYVRVPTMFGTARIYQVLDDAGDPVRLLEVGGIVQSGTYLDERYANLVFEYLKRYDLMFESGRPIRRVAVLGCGGYDYPEHLVAHHPEVICDAVEIDPAITAIARRYFHLDRVIEEYDAERDGKLNLICADALDFLESGEQGEQRAPADSSASNERRAPCNATDQDTPARSGESGRRIAPVKTSEQRDPETTGTQCTPGNANDHDAPTRSSASDEQRAPSNASEHEAPARSNEPSGRIAPVDAKYDAIVNDTFDAGKPPEHLTTPRFYRAAHARLNPGGLFLTNIVSPLKGPDAAFLHEQVALMEQVFANVGVYPCATDELAEADNVIVIASDAALP